MLFEWDVRSVNKNKPSPRKITIFIGGINMYKPSKIPFPVMGGSWHCELPTAKLD